MTRRIPRDPRFDGTRALLRDPYGFIAARSRRLGSDVFETRVLLRRTLCLSGRAVGHGCTRQPGLAPGTQSREESDTPRFQPRGSRQLASSFCRSSAIVRGLSLSPASSRAAPLASKMNTALL